MSTITKLINTNSHDYNLRKTVEELLELAEVLIKKVNKKGGPKELLDEKVIEEIGDVSIRIEVLKEIFGQKAVQDRITYKLGQFEEYIKENKYIGSI